MAVELRARQSTKWRSRRVVWDYQKVEAALAQLENREVAAASARGGGEGEAEEEEVITEEVTATVVVIQVLTKFCSVAYAQNSIILCTELPFY
ncbi:hypothetical protein ABZP36_029074 [Zizania latifolia]